MSNKIKYRILGILVVVGFVIILLPLFQDPPISSDSSVVKAPTFPVMTEEEALSDNNALMEDKTSPREKAALPDTIQEQNNKKNTDTLPDNVIEIAKPIDIDQLPENTPKVAEAINDKINKIDKMLEKNNFHADLVSVNKNNAWAIQLGSFKNKKNALRLVNQLRENGYHAFIRHISTPFSESTRVYVGPESSRGAATQLLVKLEKKLHLKGMVVHYQPLAL